MEKAWEFAVVINSSDTETETEIEGETETETETHAVSSNDKKEKQINVSFSDLVATLAMLISLATLAVSYRGIQTLENDMEENKKIFWNAEVAKSSIKFVSTNSQQYVSAVEVGFLLRKLESPTRNINADFTPFVHPKIQEVARDEGFIFMVGHPLRRDGGYEIDNHSFEMFVKNFHSDLYSNYYKNKTDMLDVSQGFTAHGTIPIIVDTNYSFGGQSHRDCSIYSITFNVVANKRPGTLRVMPHDVKVQFRNFNFRERIERDDRTSACNVGALISTNKTFEDASKMALKAVPND